MLNIRKLHFAALLSGLFLLTTSFAQTPPPAPAPAPTPQTQRPTPPPMPADRAAYMAASAQKDPAKKVDALEKFVADFPDSSSVSTANNTILTTLVQKFPEQKDRITAQVDKVIASTPEFAKSFTFSSVATTLIEAGILLEKAEEIATKGLALTEEEIAKSAKQRRASYQVALGRIYLKQGKIAKAERQLKLAFANNPQLSSAAIGLAELAEKKGDEKLALDYYVSALALGGRLTDDTRKKVDAMYAKANKGTMAGFEEAIDVKYNKLNAPPFAVTHYAKTANRSNRLVLGEVFTGAGCAPCVAADLAFDLMMERYKRDDFIVLMYHLHIPLPDPMTNQSTIARGRFYTVNGVPSYAVDGKMPSAGGGPRENTKFVYDRVNPTVEKRLELAAEADLKLEATLDGNVIKTKAMLDKFTGNAADLKLHIVLAEERLRYSGENGVRFHPMVVRSMAGTDAGGFAVKEGATNAEWKFDVAAISAGIQKYISEYESNPQRSAAFKFKAQMHNIDANALTVVAFVQDEKTKNILQTASVKLKRDVAAK
jgi:tetratricopeptide (TPR) repeat protein